MWLALAALTAICAIVGQMLYESRGELARSAMRDARNIASAVSQDISRNIELLDLSLQALRDGVVDPEVMALRPSLQRAVLFDRALGAKDIGTVFYLNDEGRIVAESGADSPRNRRLGDRDFFHVHVHDGTVGLFISRPFLSPFDDEWSLALSRRVERPDGSFGGVVVAIIKLAYFDTVFSRLELGRRGAMSLLRSDGTLLMHRPLDESDIGRILDPHVLHDTIEASRSGPIEAVSKLDGIRRIVSLQAVADLPLIQEVGVAADEVYAPWWRKLAITTFALTLLCSTILALVAYLQVELRRRARAEAAFATLAATDKLTGLPNRRQFDAVLAAEWRRCTRKDQALALLMIDVDEFKAYNDCYGHLGGDSALAAIGLCLSQALIRGGDFVARFGGEEFAVILPQESSFGATLVAERIRRLVADLHQPHAASARGFVSVSIGVACLSPRAGQSPDDLIAAADQALYEAKAGGRDRWVVREPNRAAA